MQQLNRISVFDQNNINADFATRFPNWNDIISPFQLRRPFPDQNKEFPNTFLD